MIGYPYSGSGQPSFHIPPEYPGNPGEPAEKLDLEGITADGKGGVRLASEGRTDKEIPNAIYHVDASGKIDQPLHFTNDLLKQETRFGAEGITLIDDTLGIAIQRQWQADPADTMKLLAYNFTTRQWCAVR